MTERGMRRWQAACFLVVVGMAWAVVGGSSAARVHRLGFVFTQYHRAAGDFEADAIERADPLTGEPLGGGELRFLDSIVSGPVGFPGARLAAFGGLNDGDVLLVDLRRLVLERELRLVGRPTDGFDYEAEVAAWPTPRRLVALVGQTDGKYRIPKTLLVVDPTNGRMTARRRLGLVQDWSASPDGRLVALVSPPAGQRAPWLVTTTRAGAIRSLRLDALSASSGWTFEAGIHPALAVDFRRDRAYVIGPQRTVAVVSLARMGLRYHRLPPGSLDRPHGRWSAPHGTGTIEAAAAEERQAVVLPSGLLAVEGSDSRVAPPEGDGALQQDRLIGLKLLDPTKWTVRELDPFTTGEGQLVGDSLLVTDQIGRSMFLVAYGPEGRLRYRIRQTANGFNTFTVDNLLYLQPQVGPTQVLDPRTGHVLRTFVAPGPYWLFFTWPAS